MERKLNELCEAYRKLEVDGSLRQTKSTDALRAAVTLQRVWCSLAPACWDDLEAWDTLLEWPPDVFAMCAAVLKRCGAYTWSLRRSGCSLGLLDVKKLRAHARQWRATGIPGKVIRDMWGELRGCGPVPVSAISESEELLRLLLNLLSLADEACEGQGLPVRSPFKRLSGSALLEKGWRRLKPTFWGSTLCERIHPTAARVLPKMHTPRSGLTLRSFSQHLSFCETDEVQPRWFMVPGARGDVEETKHVNLLVIPWPYSCNPSQIRLSGAWTNMRPTSDHKAGQSSKCFTFEVEDTGRAIADMVEALCDEAKHRLGSLDGVVMPELALTKADYAEVRERVLSRSLMLICGVGQAATAEAAGENGLCFDVPLSKHHAVHFRQRKHHRWRIDQDQIRNYGIGGQLDVEHSYWEDIEVQDRRILMLVLRPWLVASALICEDLARHDPVGEILRCVGPHLVIALLQDGPQLTSRWSARYATVLADDPGCSVLSLSSLGMVTLSRPDFGSKPPSRVVALWKDAYCGAAKELVLPPGEQALALTLSLERHPESTADGRTDTGGYTDAAFPVLTGVHPIQVPESKVRAVGVEETMTRSAVKFLSPHDAAGLARLVHQDPNADLSRAELEQLSDEARAIGREVWRIKSGDRPWPRHRARFSNLPTQEQLETANQIVQWEKTNRQSEKPS